MPVGWRAVWTDVNQTYSVGIRHGGIQPNYLGVQTTYSKSPVVSGNYLTVAAVWEAGKGQLRRKERPPRARSGRMGR